ncbi:Bug family tripartite tricarboxylate transporter substrate binding protein [Bordetella bronchialis]|nr:tripartite tricarboxylate transporter substrate binding protein [Bordetella bronchialis]
MQPTAHSHLTRRSMMLGGAALAAMSGVAGQARAASWPDKPLRVIVPFPPGGTTDFVTRLIGSKVGQSIGQAAIVENKPGAGTVIGVDYVAKSAPDGYSYVCVAGSFCVNSVLVKHLPYDSLRDLRPVAMMGASDQALAVYPGSGLKTLADLKKAALANPGKLSYGSFGVGTTPHLAGEMLKQQMGGLDITHIPYKGQGPALTDLLGGHTTMMFGTWLDLRDLVKSGKLVVLGMATEKRSRFAPDVPTMREQGVDIVSATWAGLLAPAKTPDDIVMRMNQEVNKALALPDVVAAFDKNSTEAMPGTPEQFAAYIQSEIAKYKKVIETAHISAEG